MSEQDAAARALAELVLSVRTISDSGLIWGTVTVDNGDGSVMVKPAGSEADVGPVWILGSPV